MTGSDDRNNTNNDLTANSISRLARVCFADADPIVRFMGVHRTKISPLEHVGRQVPPGSRVLDIGCGIGLLLLALSSADRIDSGQGIDASARAIGSANRARAHLPGAQADRLNFEHRRVEEGLPPGPYEVVMLVDVMHHVDRNARRALIRDASARVAPGGRLIYKDMCRRPLWRAVLNQFHDLVLSRQLIHYCPVERVEGWAAEESLSLVHTQNQTRMWYGHELRVFERARENDDA